MNAPRQTAPPEIRFGPWSRDRAAIVRANVEAHRLGREEIAELTAKTHRTAVEEERLKLLDKLQERRRQAMELAAGTDPDLGALVRREIA